MTVLGKVIKILGMVVSFILLVGDHHGDGVRRATLPLGQWVTIAMMMGSFPRDQILDGG